MIDPKIDTLIRAQVPAVGPGVAVAIIKGGQIIHRQGYGLANLEWNLPVTPIPSPIMQHQGEIWQGECGQGSSSAARSAPLNTAQADLAGVLSFLEHICIPDTQL